MAGVKEEKDLPLNPGRILIVYTSTNCVGGGYDPSFDTAGLPRLQSDISEAIAQKEYAKVAELIEEVIGRYARVAYWAKQQVDGRSS